MAIFFKKPTGHYYVDLYVAGRRKRWMIGPNKRQAKLVEGKLRAEIVEGKYFDIQKDKEILFKDFFVRYINEHAKINKKSWQTDEYRGKQLLIEFKNRSLYSVDRQAVSKLKARLCSWLKPATVNKHLALLQGIFTIAIEWEILHKANPVRASDYLEENNERDRYLEIAEIERLETECTKELRTVVRVAIGTGMRQGEIAGLQWTDIDFDQNFIFVRRSGPDAYSPKSGKNRVIPMCRFVREALQNHPRSVDKAQVFKTVHAEGFRAAVKRAGLYTENESFKVTFHTLRHTFASHLAIKAIDLYRIAKLIGDTFQVVERRYAHLQPRHLEEVFAIDAIWQPAQPTLIENEKKFIDAGVIKSAGPADLE